MKSVFVGAALAAAFAAVPAVAQTTVHVASFTSPTGYKTGTIHNNAGLVGNPALKDLSLQVTDFKLGIDSPFRSNVFTYCIDLAHYLYAPATYRLTTPTAVGINQMQSSAILSLLTNTLASPTNPSLDQGANTAKAAGIQLAIWEILNDTPGGWNVTSGSFSASGGTLGNVNTNGSALNLAKSYLSNVAVGGVWYNRPAGRYGLSVLSGLNSSPQVQSQIFLTPLPEPASWALMILGFGAVGYSLRARRGTAGRMTTR